MSTTLPNVDDVYPLTATQQGLLYHTLSAPESGAYVNQVITPISGSFDVPRFEQVWAATLAEHETLRTGFVWDGLDDPLQVVRSELDTEWVHLDLSGEAAAEQDRRIAELLAADRRRGFDPADPPLSRMMLVRVAAEEWKWIWSFHHLILDGWSANLILDELFARYGGTGSGGPAARAKFREFVAGYLARDEGREEAFWRRQLAGFTEPHRLEVPGLPPDPTASGYQTFTFDLGAGLSEAVEETARSLNVTLNALFVGAWALVVSRWTRSTDVVFGATVAGRPPSLPGVEHATGLFINTLPQRIPVPPGDQLGPWLRDVQRAQIETREYEQSSLASIQRWSDVDGGQPLFDSILVFENYPRRHSNRFGEIETGERTYIEQSNYPLAVLVLPGDSIRIQFVCDTAVFSPAAIEGLSGQVRAMLAAMAARPDGRLATYRLTEEEGEAWLRRVGTGPDLPAESTTIHEIIRRVAGAAPEVPAVVDPDGVISYGELLERSSAIAARLAAAGVGPNRLVGLYLPRSVDMIVGMLGILAAGGAYVPLDPAYPAGHVEELLADDGIEVVLTSPTLRDAVPAGVAAILIDDHPGSGESVPVQPASATDLAYVIHTSGSTGRPKGVMVTHDNLVRSTLARSTHYREPVGRFLLLSSFAFDSSVAGIFWTLTTGGTLVLPAPEQERDVVSLLALARRHRVTHTLCLPSLYELLLESATESQLDALQVAIVAGEACPARVLAAHRGRVPGADLHNEYGPTEATVWCTAHRASATDRDLPIGRPIAGARIFLLDEHGNPVPPGFAGELCVAGAGVVPGYLGRPDLTAERFISTPVFGADERLYRTGDLAAWRSDGVLTYLGRSDAQLKIRGHRIEPGAVEAAMRGLDGVREVAVVGRARRGRLGRQLVAYVAGDETDGNVTRSALGEGLPRHMIPDLVVPIDRLPRLPNGKVDLRRLPDPGERPGGGFVPPSNDAERTLAKLWAELLDVDAASIGVDTDFFDLGGDSLVAIRLTSAVHQEFGTAVPISALLDAPRLGDFAALLREERPTSKLLVPLRGRGPDVLFMIHPGGGNVLVYEPIARHLPDTIRAIGVQARGVEGVDEPDTSVDRMAVRYAEAIDAFKPTGVVHLVGHSTGGLVALETARALESRGRTVGLLAMLDTTFPLGSTVQARIRRQIDTVRRGRYRGLRTVADLYWGALRAAAGRIRHAPKWRHLMSKGRPLPPDLAGKRINQIALRMHREYAPRPYGGTITYLRATGDEETRYKPSAQLWRAVASDLVVREAPGTHTGDGSMVKEPHARAVADLIAAEIG